MFSNYELKCKQWQKRGCGTVYNREQIMQEIASTIEYGWTLSCKKCGKELIKDFTIGKLLSMGVIDDLNELKKYIKK